MRIVVSGGGTGGHIYPALAVCEGVKRRLADAELLYIGGSTGMETELVPQYGVPFQAVTARKLTKLVSLSTIGVAGSLLRGFQEARTYLKAFHADVVVGTGGYVAAAAVLAGVSLKIPTVILASDVVPGRTNLMLSRFVSRICVSFPETISKFPANKTVVTGFPLRSSVIPPPEVTPQAARGMFSGLKPDAFTVLVVGGSQGAKAINDLVLDSARALMKSGVQIIHQVGAKNIVELEKRADELDLVMSGGYCPVAFLNAEQVPFAFRAADVIVCRGGMSTLSEAMASGLPALIIPLPTAYADHQTANAKAVEAAGGGKCLPQASLTSQTLISEIKQLLQSPETLATMSQKSLNAGRIHAADEVAKLTLELVGKR